MSTLLYEPIHSDYYLKQDIRLKINADIYALRLNLFKYGTPTGNLNIFILDENEVILKTVVQSMSGMNDEINNTYGYGYFRFVLNTPLRKTGEYTNFKIWLQAPNYSDDNYYGWLIDWETNHINLYGSNQTDGVADYDVNKPFFIEFETYKNN